VTTPESEYRLIPLTRGQFAIVDATDYDHLTQWKWQASEHRKGWRAIRSVKIPCRRSFLMHRQIMDCPDDMVVDHINGDMLDNRRSNLRVCTSQQNRFNSLNRKGNKHSGFKGVHPNRDKWRAIIMKDRKYIHIGNFLKPEDAARAYDAKAVELFGEFANLNFPISPR
jgi:hypothetical protein